MFAPLKLRTADAVAKLEEKLEAAQEEGGAEQEIEKAKEVLKGAKEAAVAS